MIDLSVIVVTWNTRELALRCLASIEDALAVSDAPRNLSVETFVVDNGSDDGTQGAVADAFPGVMIVRLPGNRGFAGGCNAGIRRASGRHVLLLNSDTRVPPGSLERCVAYLDANPDVGIVGPQLLHPDGSRQNSIHNFPRLATEFVPPIFFQFLFRRRYPSRRWTGPEPLDVEAVTGAALFARAELVGEIGGLPEEYFFYLEETDWCWRAHEAGWRVVYLPDARITHLSGASSKRVDPALTRIEFHRSLYRFYRRNRGSVSEALAILTRFSKTLFYVVCMAPLALVRGDRQTRWKVHRRVLGWHLRGRPDAVGLGQLGAKRDSAESPAIS